MCKTIKCEFDKCLTFEKLLSAHNRASKEKNLRMRLLFLKWIWKLILLGL